MEGSRYLTQVEIEQIVKKTVHETLVQMGVDADNPMEMQQDFHTLREWRTSTESVRTKGVLTVVGLAVSGLIGLLIVGVKHVFFSGNP